MAATQLFNSLSSYVLAMRVQGIKRATKYVADDLVVKITSVPRKRPSKARSRSVSATVTVGRPNYAERKFIKSCKKAGEKIPVRKVQLRRYR